MNNKLILLSFCLVTLFFGTVYVSVHQVYRQSANDPQIQIAEDIALRLKNGQPVDNYKAPADAVIDIEKSLAPYLVVYDVDGKPIAGNGILEGALPTLPQGVFEYTKKHMQDRITWQPRKGVRSAIVVQYYEGTTSGFVMIGRSLREVEERIERLTKMVGLAWLASLILIVVHRLLVTRKPSQTNPAVDI